MKKIIFNNYYDRLFIFYKSFIKILDKNILIIKYYQIFCYNYLYPVNNN